MMAMTMTRSLIRLPKFAIPRLLNFQEFYVEDKCRFGRDYSFERVRVWC